MIPFISSSIHVIRAAIGQFALGQRPDPFVGVKFWSIRRKMLQVETWILVQEILQRPPLMSRGIIQQNNHRAM
jgi:hypothetical protein